MGFAFYASLPLFSSLLFLFFCLLYIAYACMYGCINSIVATCQATVQRGKFHFLSLLVKQLGAWIGCVFRGIHKVHRADKTLKQLRFAFLSYLSVFYNCGRSFSGRPNHCLRIEDFFSLMARNY